MKRRLPTLAAITLVGLAVILSLPAAASATPAFAKTTGIGVTGATTATVLGTINPENESTSYALQWGVGNSVWCTSGGTSGSPAQATPETTLDPSWFPSYVSVDLTGLTYETSYCAQFVATNADGEGDGGQVTWVQSLPEVDTSDAYSTSAISGIVEGEINPHHAPTDYQAEYATATSDWCTSDGTSGTPSTNLDFADLGFTDDTFHHVSVKLFQLTPGETYCARLVAYSGGKGEGQLLTFTVNMPGAFTDAASSTGGSTATVTGTVNPNGQTTTYEAQYATATSNWCTSGGASGSPQTTAPTTLGYTDGEFHEVSVDLTGLTPPTEYCARIIATNPNGQLHGSQVTWTQGSPPDAFTYDGYSIGATTATVEGTADPHAEDTTYVAQYDVAGSTWCMSGGTSGSPAHTTTGTDPIPSDDFVSVDLSGLTEHTDYCAQLVATNANGESDGGVVTWTQGAPTAETFDGFATGVSTATVEGDVNPAGKATTWALQYDLSSSTWCESSGTSGSPANTTTARSLGFTDGSFHDVSVDLTGLAPNSSYCGKFVATNADGSSTGGQEYWLQPTAFTLTVILSSVFGNGTGTVTSSPAGIDCGAGGSTCSYEFPAGSQVTLSATPAAGSTFERFIGGPCNGPGTCTVTMDTDRSVSAVFGKSTTQTLTVTVPSTGAGSVTSSPAGISCGSICSHAFPTSSQVTLTATPAAGWDFDSWSGSGCSGNGPCVVTMSLDQTVTANFTPSFSAPVPKPVQCVVPKLKGKKLAAAKTALRNHHCRVGRITRTKSSKRNRGRVISEKPKPGRHLRKGAKVALKIGK
jgi:hypothetical protein